MVVMVAHLSELTTTNSAQTVGLLLAFLFCGVLLVEHLWVKNGGFSKNHIRAGLAAVATIVLIASVAPLPVMAQAADEPRGLPDLVSDPPLIWRTRDIRTPDGDIARVLTFDGYIHNIGTGKLHISGNPQVEGGMQQWVFDGDNWNSVGTPTVKFETDDGHNHFHLISAVDYALWTHDRSQQVSDSSKVGFCLVDTEQMEEGFGSNYLIEDFDYCGVDKPDTTELVMGITPGWRDTYDANVTFQWIDISNIEPGLYWTSAITDPNNEIVESNEDNNSIVYSRNRFAVDGYVARELEPQLATEPIVLKSNAFGVVGDRAFVIESGPNNGTLDVPIGVDLLHTNTVSYAPNPGFKGTDSFTYFAVDTASNFPLEPRSVEVTIDASATSDADTGPSSSMTEATATEISLADPATLQTALYERVESAALATELPSDSGARWYARDLPPGLTIDHDSGVIAGVPTFVDDFVSTIVVSSNEGLFEGSLSWTVEHREPVGLVQMSDFSTSSAQRLTLPVGTETAGAAYTGTGLPDGGFVVSNLPLLGGVAQEIGTFTVRVQELIDDEVVDEIEFEWTVRPSTQPAFVL